MSTVFHCILCPTEADGHYPEFTTPDAISDHLATVHQAPKLYLMKETQRLFSLRAAITRWNIEDATGRIVGHAETTTKRGEG